MVLPTMNEHYILPTYVGCWFTSFFPYYMIRFTVSVSLQPHSWIEGFSWIHPHFLLKKSTFLGIFTLMMTWGLRNCFVICMYVYMYTSCHHIKILVKICIFEHFGIKKCDCYMYVCMYVCMYVAYKLPPHKIFSRNMYIWAFWY